ncbi:hypothetical protein [Phormidium tenue]|uniref:HNH nuclease domain-containing protein n=1 Tax=Phormidium tenue NIES-30 TaxID=549789 RepID=A0A1U7J6Q0_9CYAN|nr:hypothetical protein [Phormidium tenue]MBD2233580.1 hypothetical protein [Phormidium tenue FACHB-1052]OKH48681.1 hypothetical protein NIES30_09055 [Phormidium tenue NIES-30]
MARDTSNFTIRDEELAKALEITVEELEKIIRFFESDPNDEWELREKDHYIYINRNYKERIFAEHGAFAIAKYMDSVEPKSFWATIIEFITRHKEKLRNAFVRRKIHENCSSLTLRNNRHFLSKKDAVNIFCTSYARLNRAFDAIQSSGQPLEKFKDFDDFDGVRYYSLSGFYRLGKELSQSLTVKDRREWCKALEVVGEKAFKLIISAEESRKKEIEKAKNAAKDRDRKTCQITLIQSSRAHKFDLAAHHIYSDKAYPDLAACVDNLITLNEEIHKEFHTWNGGTRVSCTADDMINFIMERYPDAEEVLLKLYRVKSVFGHHQPTAASGRRSFPPAA